MTAKILLVDDVNMFLELQKGFLKLSSAKIMTARDGIEALDMARKEIPSLIFMDMHMPRMDGAQCCRLLKQDPFLKNIPVIMVTAAGKDEDRAVCVESGCDDFLTKPLDRTLFLEKARKYLPTIDRRNPRIACRVKVRFYVFGLTLSGEIFDVSEGGVFMATNYEVRPGTMMDLFFSLPDASGAKIESRGRVAWLNQGTSRKKPDLPEGFGIELVSLTEDMRKALRRFTEGKP